MPTFTVRADYRQFYLFDEAANPPYPENIADVDIERRMTAVPALVAVYTARDSEVEVAIECTTKPQQIDHEAFEHIVEGPLNLPSGRIVLAGPTSYVPNCPRVTVAPGSYRVRVAASSTGDAESERYLISLWPSEARAIRLIKSVGRRAA